MNILQLRDPNTGKFMPVPCLVGPKGDPGVYMSTEAPTDKNVQVWIDPEGDWDDESGGIEVTGASVGQTVKIAAVDGNGVPTAWEPADFPGGGDNWVRHEFITTEAGTAEVIIDAGEGKQFKKARIAIVTGAYGLSAASKIELRASTGTTFNSNNHAMGLTSSTVSTHSYPVFMLESGPDSFPVCLVSNGAVNGTTMASIQMGGVGVNLSTGTQSKYSGPWRYLRIAPQGSATFNAGVKIYVWGVYA